MKLSKRTLLLIIPVVVLSAAISSYIIYLGQHTALIKLEKSSIQLNMEKLASHYSRAANFLNSYTYTLSHSDVLRSFFNDTHNPYREFELSRSLHQTLTDLTVHNGNFAALGILDNQFRTTYYVENQVDPYSWLDKKIASFVKQGVQNGIWSQTEYLFNKEAGGVLVKYDIYNRQTFSSAKQAIIPENFFVVVAMIETTEYDNLRHALEREHLTVLTYAPEPPTHTRELTHSVQLSPTRWATLDPSSFVVENKLGEILFKLLIAFSMSSFITVSLLILLFYRYVIFPITRLAKQLREVENRQRANIQRLDTDDEIGHLSHKFYEMYQSLADNYQKTKQLAEMDQLTKLANRRYFQSQVAKALALTQDTDEEEKHCILYIDLDNFKFVNDKYGHKIGDALLVQFAKNLNQLEERMATKHQVRILSSRLSGDEFAVYISGSELETSIIHHFCQSILQPLQSGFISPVGTFPITVSIGVATYPMDGDNIEHLLSNADTAMYQAKRAGKNQYTFYSKALDKEVQRISSIERALRRADYQDEFSLVYMPYMNSSGTKVVGVEALLRWNSQKLGTVEPSEFIPLAEQTGLFETIDRWVIEKAFSNFHQIQSLFEQPVQLSVNLSSAELDSCQLATFIEQKAQQYQIPYHQVDFEITETFAAESQGYPLLHELSSQGFELAIDDFGSGYTSFTQLVQYPVQKIKFDRGFLLAMLESNKQHIIKPLIELCHSQNISVTAEGVESQQMHTWLLQSGCDYMQGYYFGQPMSLDQLKGWKADLYASG
ncbi:Biofilm architecture maintenance protein mbaA [Vibrio nigripulchritudo SO65]|uniref:putative bifunctional diguanylate cyclase/phosphodiesterase n=1 Tax=Vibrio TaxID=662 RepID=UPI0003B1CFD8|nr:MULTISPECIES: EAL domain-containing protein [Vibrio]UAB70955.1 EAL domain-containing protein [Vibrio sp. SCSIO 43132]CCN33566.1 Biofilm architecture maintenance protein mbaA [Vibrio nigripulchritudo AM115]CCN40481.1 Biofilm architecture maintenance protein mbaA [Vibrio nigripulchritudo FTn2]CCN63575.1 Biofilm architecture maintenance protein mbaA [Vibrio nigripulchritudo POn4]CCN77731.1 Biofilm architecture maintenance protein mbaA [Vibrio nigripulchritudo SO65]